MNFVRLRLRDVIKIEPKVFGDDRGFFMETYHQRRFSENGIDEIFVQDNHSRSAAGVIRGLHYQLDPCAQGKLVRVVRGAIFDVAVDLRRGSATFGQWVGENLSEENKCQLYIPPGFAHGFCVLQNNTDVVYKVTQLYSPQHDRGVFWNDPEIAIAWPQLGVDYLVSDKDQKNPKLREVVLGA